MKPGSIVQVRPPQKNQLPGEKKGAERGSASNAFLSQDSSSSTGKSWQRFWPVLVSVAIFLSLMSVSLSMVFLNLNQDTRKQADQVSDNVTLNWKTRVDNGKVIADVMVNTKTYAIAGIELRGSIQGVKSASVTVSAQNPLGLQPVVQELTDVSGQTATTFLITSFAPIDPNLPVITNNTEQVVATFTISNVPSNGVEVKFGSDSKIPVLERTDIGLQIGGNQSVSIAQVNAASPVPETPDSSKKSCNQNCATDTECQSALRCYKGQCRVAGDLEDANCSKLKDNGLQRSCNQYCADGRECQNQFVCYFNQCRNPKNVTSSSCADPVKSVAKPVVNTGVGGKGSSVAVVVPTPSPKVPVVTVITPTPSTRPSVSPVATASARPTPTVSPKISPIASARPSASPQPTSTSSSSSGSVAKTVLAFVAVISGVGLFGFSLYKLFKH